MAKAAVDMSMNPSVTQVLRPTIRIVTGCVGENTIVVVPETHWIIDTMMVVMRSLPKCFSTNIGKKAAPTRNYEQQQMVETRMDAIMRFF